MCLCVCVFVPVCMCECVCVYVCGGTHVCVCVSSESCLCVHLLKRRQIECSMHVPLKVKFVRLRLPRSVLCLLHPPRKQTSQVIKQTSTGLLLGMTHLLNWAALLSPRSVARTQSHFRHGPSRLHDHIWHHSGLGGGSVVCSNG